MPVSMSGRRQSKGAVGGGKGAIGTALEKDIFTQAQNHQVGVGIIVQIDRISAQDLFAVAVDKPGWFLLETERAGGL